MTDSNESFLEGVKSVTSIRCSEHAGVPPFNHNEYAGGECAACAVVGVQGFLEVEREAGRISREKAQFQFQRANKLERELTALRAKLETALELASDAIQLASNFDNFIHHDRGVGPYYPDGDLVKLTARYDALSAPESEASSE